MGDQGVNMWREGMQVGSILRDGISESVELGNSGSGGGEGFRLPLAGSLIRKRKRTRKRTRLLLVVTDPEALPHLLHHALHTSLSVDPTEHPLLLTESAWNTRQARELLAEVAFEGEGVPGVYIACSSVLSA